MVSKQFIINPFCYLLTKPFLNRLKILVAKTAPNRDIVKEMSAKVLHLPLNSWIFLDKHKGLMRRTWNPTQLNNWARPPSCSFSQFKPFTLAKTFNPKTDHNLTREYKIRWTNNLMLKVSLKSWRHTIPSKWIWPLKQQQANPQTFIWLVRKTMDNEIHITKTD